MTESHLTELKSSQQSGGILLLRVRALKHIEESIHCVDRAVESMLENNYINVELHLLDARKEVDSARETIAKIQNPEG